MFPFPPPHSASIIHRDSSLSPHSCCSRDNLHTNPASAAKKMTKFPSSQSSGASRQAERSRQRISSSDRPALVYRERRMHIIYATRQRRASIRRPPLLQRGRAAKHFRRRREAARAERELATCRAAETGRWREIDEWQRERDAAESYRELGSTG